MNRLPIHCFVMAFIVFFSLLSAEAQTAKEYADSSEDFYNHGNFKTALVYAEKARPIIERDSGKNSHAYARFADQYMGMIYEAIGNSTQALNWYQAGIALYKQLGETQTFEYGEAAANLGNFYTSMGAYDMAEALLLDAREIFKNVPLDTSEDYGAATNNLAIVYGFKGRYAEAATIQRDLLEKVKKAYGEESNRATLLYNNLGTSYGRIGQYGKALQLLKKANTWYEKERLADKRDYVTNVLNIVTMFGNLNQLDSAEKYTEMALAETEGTGYVSSYTNALLTAASLRLRKKNYRDAETFYTKALALVNGGNEVLTSTYYTAASNLAQVYNLSGKYRPADSLFKIAFAKIYSLGQPDFRILSFLYQGYCSLLLSTKRFAEAADSLQALGRLTLPYIRQNFAGMSEEEKLSFINTLYRSFDLQYALLSLDKNASPSFAQHAFSNSLLLKGLVLFSQTAVIRAVSSSGDSVLKSEFDRWLLLKQLLGKQYLLDPRQRVLNVDSLAEAAGEAEKQWTRYAPAKEALFSYNEVPLKELTAKLAPDERMIEFVRFTYPSAPKNELLFYGAFVLGPGDAAPHFVTLCSEASLNSLVGEGKGSHPLTIYPVITYSQTIATPEGRRFYQLVWKPLNPFLSKANKIYYSPAGLLNHISFNAVSNGDHGVLMDKYRLYALLNISDFSAAGSKVAVSNAGLWGNINYNETEDSLGTAGASPTPPYSPALPDVAGSKGRYNGAWPPISEKEINTVAGLLQQKGINGSLTEGKNASEDAFKTKTNGFAGLLHLSTHGFYAPDTFDVANGLTKNIFTDNINPMLRCGLVFAGGNQVWQGGEAKPGKEDGILTGYEISELDLSKTEIITLSACKTGLGKIEGYEGLFGLQRAFKMAGARKLLMSLWEVPINKTSELMKRFYSHWLNENLSPQEALLTAQREMRKTNDPYSWAGFILLE